MKPSTENKLKKLQELLRQKEGIEAQIEALIEGEKKKAKIRDDEPEERFHYYDETMAVFRENPSQVFKAGKVSKLIQKRTGFTVDESSVKSTIMYAYGRGTIERVDRGKYRLNQKQENMPEVKMQQPVET